MNDRKNPADESFVRPKTVEGGTGATTPRDNICQKAPEWAEHSRFYDKDEPCDDGRWGNLEREPEKK